MVLVLSVERSASSIVVTIVKQGTLVIPRLSCIVWSGDHRGQRAAIFVRFDNWSPRRSIIVRVVWSGDHRTLWSSITVRVWSVNILLRRRSPG